MQPVPDAQLRALCARLAPRLRAVFLDAGNTLIYPDWERIARWCAEAASPCPAERLMAAEYVARTRWDAFMAGRIPRPAGGYFATVLEAASVAQGARGAVLERIEQAAEAGTLWLAVRPGTAESLRKLRELGLTLGVVSNADGRVEQFLETAGLRPYLDFVVDSTLVGVEKPDPRIFQIALERAGVGPGEAVHVGDIFSVDVVGARSAGIEGVAMDPLWLYESCNAPRLRHLQELAGELARWRLLAGKA
ncbi:MAG: HAD-IA family hydrolase [Bacillota bacterium]